MFFFLVYGEVTNSLNFTIWEQIQQQNVQSTLRSSYKIEQNCL